MNGFFDKLLGVLQSRRFWAAVGGVMVVIFQDAIGFDEQTANGVVATIIAWIVGDSLTKTEKLSDSK